MKISIRKKKEKTKKKQQKKKKKKKNTVNSIIENLSWEKPGFFLFLFLIWPWRFHILKIIVQAW